MALAQLLNRACNSPDAVFRTIRDFLLSDPDGIDDFGPSGNNPGPGYELVDASYASGNPADTTTGDWCVLRSHGEANTYPHYLRLSFGAAQHGINVALHWDSDEHVGYGLTTRNTNINHNGAGEVRLYIHADLDECHIIILPRATTTWFWHPCGRIKPDHTFYDGAAVQVSAAIAAGSDTTITLPSWPAWAEVGRKIYNWDTSGLHELEIVAASESTRVITVASSYDKAAGSWLAEDIFLYTVSSYNTAAGASNWLYGLPDRAAAASGSLAVAAFNGAFPGFSGTENKYNMRYGVDIWLHRAGEVRGRLGNARYSNQSPASPGEAWVDDKGQPWRLYTVYSGAGMAFREAI